MKFDANEEEANGHLISFMDWLREERLNCNQGEMAHAIHTLQMFVIKHMLQRLEAEGFSDWYDGVRQ